MNNGEARKLKMGTRLVPVKGRIRSNDYTLAKIDHMIVEKMDQTYYNGEKDTLSGPTYDVSGEKNGYVRVFCDCMTVAIIHPDDYDVFICK